MQRALGLIILTSNNFQLHMLPVCGDRPAVVVCWVGAVDGAAIGVNCLPLPLYGCLSWLSMPCLSKSLYIESLSVPSIFANSSVDEYDDDDDSDADASAVVRVVFGLPLPKL